jgi:microcin C transport system ATP-binding protein
MQLQRKGNMNLLQVDNLSVAFSDGAGSQRRVVDGISFSLQQGEFVAIVGESGSGKSVTALSLMQLLPKSKVTYPSGGSIIFEGKDLLTSTLSQLKRIRGNNISMIFQEPLTSLNPVHTIGKQISESLLLHQQLTKRKLKQKILELLDTVELTTLKHRLKAYPHELSGGQRQRVMIAIALANQPKLLIADEPTTALDVTVQQHILTLLKKLQHEHGMTVLFITHDLSIVRKMANRTYVMHEGKIVESGATANLFATPQHAYTKKLLSSEPQGTPAPIPSDTPIILTTEKLVVNFTLKKNFFGKVTQSICAVNQVTLSLKQGETLGIAGESGSGKSTLAFALLRLIHSNGPITLLSQRLDLLKGKSLRPLRKDMQIIFQDPFSSLNPRMSISQIIEEGLLAHHMGASILERRQYVQEALVEVGLEPEMANRYPHEFSGGQRQRVAIARAIVLKPKLIIFDEPTSALDVVLQLQIIELLRKLQLSHQLSYIFISHDLRVIRTLSHRIMIMKDGHVVETGKTEDIFTKPQTDYTKELISASLLSGQL